MASTPTFISHPPTIEECEKWIRSGGRVSNVPSAVASFNENIRAHDFSLFILQYIRNATQHLLHYQEKGLDQSSSTHSHASLILATNSASNQESMPPQSLSTSRPTAFCPSLTETTVSGRLSPKEWPSLSINTTAQPIAVSERKKRRIKTTLLNSPQTTTISTNSTMVSSFTKMDTFQLDQMWDQMSKKRKNKNSVSNVSKRTDTIDTSFTAATTATAATAATSSSQIPAQPVNTSHTNPILPLSRSSVTESQSHANMQAIDTFE